MTIAAGESHIAPILDWMLGIKREFASSRVIKKWLSDIL